MSGSHKHAAFQATRMTKISITKKRKKKKKKKEATQVHLRVGIEAWNLPKQIWTTFTFTCESALHDTSKYNSEITIVMCQKTALHLFFCKQLFLFYLQAFLWTNIQNKTPKTTNQIFFPPCARPCTKARQPVERINAPQWSKTPPRIFKQLFKIGLGEKAVKAETDVKIQNNHLQQCNLILLFTSSLLKFRLPKIAIKPFFLL